MVEQTTEQPSEETKPEHQMVLYDVCSRYFEIKNLYAMGGLRPNARHIARQYNCKLEIRDSRYRPTGMESWLDLDRHGIADDGSCLSAVLVGDDREELAKARADIHKTYGVAPFTKGAISIGS